MKGVILCGGNGTRLWPLSRKNFPKQFLKLYSDRSLLQETFLRLQKVMAAEDIYLVTNQENYFNVLNQIREIHPQAERQRIIVEPASLNTAPAIMLAVRYLTEEMGVGEQEKLIFLPADHYIAQPDKFAATVRMALEEVGDEVGTIGIKPTGPETGFGYIEEGESRGSYRLAKSFQEKPDRTIAEKYLATGDYVWNSGMYLFSPATFRRELKLHAPELSAACELPYADFLARFAKLTPQPIDTAISEKSDRVIVFEGDFGWSDIGSFDVLAEIARQQGVDGGRQAFIDSKNVYAHSASGKLIVTLGVEDLIIVESNDVVFVQKKGRSEDVKQVVNYLKQHNCKEVEHNVIVYRPWGKYEVLVDDPHHKVKKITVFPGATLSLQSHQHRSEHWVVVKGSAAVINGEQSLTLGENESTYIPAQAKHRLTNPGSEELEIIEVQTGDYLGEDDIVRYEDEYGRLAENKEHSSLR